MFTNRQEAGRKLASLIRKNWQKHWVKNSMLVMSLLKGGALVGAQIAKILNLEHWPLVVTKIPAPGNPELALGAVCQDVVYLDKHNLDFFSLSKKELAEQIQLAKTKQQTYLKQFKINQLMYRNLKHKTVLLVDDGVATGATMKAAQIFVKRKQPEAVYVTTPVAARHHWILPKNQAYVLHWEDEFKALSQFYQNFEQVTPEQIKTLFTIDIKL